MNTNLKLISKSLIIAGVVSAVSLPAAANKYRNYTEQTNSSYDYAKVVEVNPVVESYQVNNPIEKCWDERQAVRNSGYSQRRHKSRTPEIFGAIIGAAVGNQLGKRGGGKARDVATVAGAVLGGSVARDIKKENQRRRDYYDDEHNGRYENTRYETVQRCEVQDSYTTREEVVGYDVAYKYRGNVFHTQMGEHPGERIKVKVTVDPV
jgi:uncharacterized protein YcfJ